MAKKQNIKRLTPKAPFNARKGWHHEYRGFDEFLVRDGFTADEADAADSAGFSAPNTISEREFAAVLSGDMGYLGIGEGND